MKRDRDFVQYDVKKIFPIFEWRLCDKCKQEFKLEYGWSVKIEEIDCGCYFKTIRTYCQDCFKTKNDVLNKIIAEIEFKKNNVVPPKEE